MVPSVVRGEEEHPGLIHVAAAALVKQSFVIVLRHVARGPVVFQVLLLIVLYARLDRNALLQSLVYG